MKIKALVTFAIVGVVSLGIGVKAYAKTDAYLVKDNGKNIVYEFNKDELVGSFLNSKSGEDCTLYNEYMKIFSRNGLYAFHDNTKKYVDYKEVEEAFLDCKNSGKGFNLDDFTEKKGKSMTGMPKKVTKVTAPGGKVVYKEKETGSSEEVGDLEVISIE
ncbi:hypothetical protein IRP63_09965 [Clostridium botulinum]|uniref:Uncharacterized protein n=1 Tax=Clostridium botulinum C/D str. DC5 TaxID=1443128 RepID=A0A0A0IG46_CLOBO|nr:hypothetical protein [Clostridium botulinum]KGM99962.1 hypothetical protein Z955_05140 [Clostridium botulinum C/D str. DC5]KOC56080.1 hypothetical protein ADU89_04110 [Clostridium botulinum]KOC57712.1 hypothetical protein ADU90_04225 [Clostridium botulinum]MCD3233718.1 hypothetical protein [Clostridium botulinum D/C]MCD3239479.1 hypothetical protein [Clostridium botulinum D/C]